MDSAPTPTAVTTGHSGAEQGPPDDEIPATSVVILEQKPFDKGSKKCPGIPPVQYDNYNLKSALERDYAELDNHSGQAFPPNASFAQKVSVRLQFAGHRAFGHQAHILRVRKGSTELPSRGRLATVIAKDVERFLELEKGIHNALMYNGREVTLDMLVLREVVVVSSGSLQPVIGVRIA